MTMALSRRLGGRRKHSHHAAPACCFSIGSVSTTKLLAHDMTDMRGLYQQHDNTTQPSNGAWSGTAGLTGVDGKVQHINRQDSQSYGRRLGRLVIQYDQSHQFSCEAQHKEAEGDNGSPNDHKGPSPSPFGRVFVSDDADDWLDQEPGKRPGNPYQRCVGLCQAQIK